MHSKYVILDLGKLFSFNARYTLLEELTLMVICFVERKIF